METPTTLIWLGIVICISQSAIFSGLNLALFSVSRLRLEVEAAAGNRVARQAVSSRGDANGLLTTILWGNVSVNALLALLSNSVMAGAAALDDVPLSRKGKPLDPASVLPISVVDGHLIFPAFERRPDDPFLRQVNASGHKWVVLIDSQGQPAFILDADGLLRARIFWVGCYGGLYLGK